MKRDGLFELKRKWLPLLVLGAAIFGAGLTLGLLWLYRESPRWVTDTVVDFLTPSSPEPPPRGTLISIAALMFIAVGGSLLFGAIRGIRGSEVGEINTFWWKVAVGALAGQWWLGEPRIVVLAAGPQTPLLLRALKPISSRIAVLSRATPELAIALAEDETSLGKGRRVLVGAVAAPTGERLRDAKHWCTTHFGSFHSILMNSNKVPDLPVGLFYQILDEGMARDVTDWNAPGQWDVPKLAVFLREAIGRT